MMHCASGKNFCICTPCAEWIMNTCTCISDLQCHISMIWRHLRWSWRDEASLWTWFCTPMPCTSLAATLLVPLSRNFSRWVNYFPLVQMLGGVTSHLDSMMVNQWLLKSGCKEAMKWWWKWVMAADRWWNDDGSGSWLQRGDEMVMEVGHGCKKVMKWWWKWVMAADRWWNGDRSGSWLQRGDEMVMEVGRGCR